MKRANKFYFFIKMIFILLLFAISNNNLFSAIETSGKEFWLSFMSNGSLSSSTFQVSISTKFKSNVTIKIPNLSWSSNYDIPADTTVVINIPNQEGSGAINIVSDSNINVSMLNYCSANCDGSAVYPLDSLSNEYYAMTYSYDSEFSIVATEDSTILRITPANNYRSGAHLKGVTYDTLLNKGQVSISTARLDLTGSHIISVNNKPFALFSGNVSVNIPEDGNASNHLSEQILPIKSWGTEYIAVPFKSRLKSDVYCITASVDNTLISIDGVPINTKLNKGDVYTLELNQASKITTNYPIALGQFSKSESADGVYSDPSFLLLKPTNQLCNDVIFNTFTFADTVAVASCPDDSIRYYINVIIKTEDVSSMYLDKKSISAEFNTLSFDDQYSYAQIKISQGFHRLYSSNRHSFTAYQYGFRWKDAFSLALSGYKDVQIIDNLPPQVSLVDESCYSMTYKIIDNIVSDIIDGEQQYDTGIKSIELINSNNLSMELLTSPTFRTDTTYYEFLIKISVNDQLISAYGVLKIIDNAGNIKYDTLNVYPYLNLTITSNPTDNNIKVAVDEMTGKVKNVSFDISISNNQNKLFSFNKFNYIFTYKTNWFIFKGIEKSSDLDNSWTIQVDKNITIGDSTYLYISGKGNNITDSNVVLSKLNFDVYYDNSIEYLPYTTNFKSNALSNDSCYTFNYINELLNLVICGSDIMKFNFSGTNYYLNVTPNPSQSNNIKIQYGIGLDSYLRIEIYNSYGELVNQIYNQEVKAGEYQNDINISDLSAGIYYIKIASGPYLETKKLIIIK